MDEICLNLDEFGMPVEWAQRIVVPIFKRMGISGTAFATYMKLLNME